MQHLTKLILVILMMSTLASITACGKRGAPIRPSEVPAASQTS